MSAVLALCAAPALAETGIQTSRYTCDRGVSVPATYVNADDMSLVVLQVDGGQITLFAEPAGSGVRYGWPSDGSSYVWWTKGAEASLFWKEPGAETLVLTCQQTD